jgi:hypothetical protein
MRRLNPAFGMLATSVALLAMPAAAAAEYYVPPGNSAATQYTEALPTAGGHRDAEKGEKSGGRTPKDVLGAGNARRLDQHGQAGRETAEFAAATAPTADGTPTGKRPSSAENPGAGHGDGGQKAEEGQAGGGIGGNASGPGGSSGLGSVLAEATGTSSGGIGLLLPLVILATAGWAFAFLLGQRSRSRA